MNIFLDSLGIFLLVLGICNLIHDIISSIDCWINKKTKFISSLRAIFFISLGIILIKNF